MTENFFLDNYIIPQENALSEKIISISESIQKSAEKKPVVLLSGASGSGKTTVSGMISHELSKMNIPCAILTMDNYFFSLSEEQTKLAQNGKLDYESPKRLDKKLFCRDMTELICGGTISLPEFDFSLSRRFDSGIRVSRENGGIVIAEGIHALNPEVTGDIQDRAVMIYAGVFDSIGADSGETITPQEIRLVRRILRDRQYRGQPAEITLDKYNAVNTGEQRYITPYMNMADIKINTHLGYEMNVYKSLVSEDLRRQSARYFLAKKISDYFATIESVDPELVPARSLIREFIG